MAERRGAWLQPTLHRFKSCSSLQLCGRVAKWLNASGRNPEDSERVHWRFDSSPAHHFLWKRGRAVRQQFAKLYWYIIWPALVQLQPLPPVTEGCANGKRLVLKTRVWLIASGSSNLSPLRQFLCLRLFLIYG